MKIQAQMVLRLFLYMSNEHVLVVALVDPAIYSCFCNHGCPQITGFHSQHSPFYQGSRGNVAPETEDGNAQPNMEVDIGKKLRTVN
jgi:hypothetical protein